MIDVMLRNEAFHPRTKGRIEKFFRDNQMGYTPIWVGNSISGYSVNRRTQRDVDNITAFVEHLKNGDAIEVMLLAIERKAAKPQAKKRKYQHLNLPKNLQNTLMFSR